MFSNSTICIICTSKILDNFESILDTLITRDLKRSLFLASRKVGDSGTGSIMPRKGRGRRAATVASWKED